MKKYNIIVVLLFITLSLTAQSLLDKELSTIANNLVTQVGQKMSGQNIAIGDFVNAKDEPSDLGKYLAEEFSYTLVNQAKNFHVVDRMQFKKLLEEAQLGDRGMTDPSSVQKLGRLKGITAVVYGKLIPTGNVIKVFTKVVILEEQVNTIVVRGNITRSPTIEKLIGEENLIKSPCPEGNSVDLHESVSAIFTNQHIKIELKDCSRQGNNIDCKLQITSVGKNDNFAIKISDSFLQTESGKSFRPSSLSMNGKKSSIQVNQPLKANQSTTVVIRFKGIPQELSTFSLLALNCRSYSAYSFVAQLKNIISR